MGYGWALAGLSMVQRTGKNKFFDGAYGPVKFDNTDNYLFDGARLISLGSGLYSKEISDLSNIHATGTLGAYTGFTVKTRNGYVSTYGLQSGANGTLYTMHYDPAQIKAYGWLLDKSTDNHGNSIYYFYENTGNLSEIRYGGTNPKDNPLHKVVFTYTYKADNNSVFFTNGSKLTSDRLLKSISVITNGVQQRKYSFDYAYDGTKGPNRDGSKLVKVNLTEGSQEINHTQIVWQTTNSDFLTNQKITIPSNVQPFPDPDGVFVADFNGDKLDDIAIIHGRHSIGTDGNGNPRYMNSKFSILLRSTDGSYSHAFTSEYNVVDPTLTAPYNYRQIQNMWIHDYENDGKFEIITQENWQNSSGISDAKTRYIKNVFAKGYTSGAPTRTLITYTTNGGEVAAAVNSRIGKSSDYDGDGLFDFYINRVNSWGGIENTIFSQSSTISYNKFDNAGILNTKVLFSTDINGDGQSEIVAATDIIDYPDTDLDDIDPGIITNKVFSYQNGDFVEFLPQLYGIVGNATQVPIFGDYNGDGLDDILGYYFVENDYPTFYYDPAIYLNTFNNYAINNSFTSYARLFLKNRSYVNYEHQNTQNEVKGLFIFSGEFNGDGKSDLLYIKPNPNVQDGIWDNWIFVIGYSNGDGFDYEESAPIIFGNPFDKKNVVIRDINKDGNDDIFIVDKYGNTEIWYVNKREAGSDRLVSSITTGNGNTVSFSYNNPFVSSTAYTSTGTPAFPYFESLPSRVVASMTVPDGLPTAGTLSTTYSYTDSKFHLLGKGYLGFDKVTNQQTIGTIASKTEVTSTRHASSLMPYASNIKNYYSETGTATLITETTITPAFTAITTTAPYAYLMTDGTITETNASTGVTNKITSNYDLTYSSTSRTFGDLNSLVNQTYANTTGTPSAANITTNTTTYGYADKVLTNGATARIVTNITKSQQIGSGTAYSRITYSIGNVATDIDSYGRATKVSDDKGVTRNFTYNSFGNILTTSETFTDGHTVANNYSQSYSYSPDGRFLKSFTNNLGLTTKYEYSERTGNLERVIYPDNTSTTYDSYDALGRILTKTDVLGNQTTYTYNWGTLPTRTYNTIQQPNSPKVTTYQDIFDRETKTIIENWNGNAESNTTYDAIGRVTSHILPHLSTDLVSNFTQSKTYTADGTQRIESFTDRGYVHGYAYSGLSSTYTEPGSVGRQFTTNRLYNGLVSEYDGPNGNVKIASFHGSGDPTKIELLGNSGKYDNIFYINPLGDRTEFSDKNMTNPNKYLYEYNPDGTTHKVTDPKGKSTIFKYDPSSGQLQWRSIDNVKTFYEYNSATDNAPKALKKMYFEGANPQTIEYTYDRFGRVTASEHTVAPSGISKTFKLVNATSYDSYGNVQDITYPNGVKISYTYKPTGELEEIKCGSQTLWKLITSKANGLPTEYKIGARTMSQTYTAPFDYPDKTYYKDAPVSGLIYDVDFENDIGLVTARKLPKSSSTTENFTYDYATRLLTWGSSKSVTYETGNTGNIKTKSDVGTYTYNSINPYRLDEVSGSSMLTSLDLTTNYTAFNKIESITLGTETATFTYGPDLERIAMKDGNDYVMIYNGNYEAQADIQGNITTDWVYVLDPFGKLIAYVRTNNGTQTIYGVHTDHLGSPILTFPIANSDINNHTLVRKYDAWGLRYTGNDNSLSNLTVDNTILRRGFTMHEHLDKYGIINMNGRIYDPKLGRFLQSDPYVAPADNAQAYNAYAYVYNNPVKYTDATGENPVIIIIAAAVIVGGINLASQAAQGNVHTWQQGVGYFAVGAVAGAVGAATGGVGGFAMAGAIQGGGNALVGGGTAMDVYKGALIGGIAGAVGGVTGGAAGGGIVAQGAIGGGAGGFTSGFLTGLSSGQGLEGALASGIVGGVTGFALGAGMGFAYGVGAKFYAKWQANRTNAKLKAANQNNEKETGSGGSGTAAEEAANSGKIETVESEPYQTVEVFDAKPTPGIGRMYGYGRNKYTVKVHGNSLASKEPTWGYKLYSKDGIFLKNGITSKPNPLARYTKAYMADKYMVPVKQFSNRLEAWQWEYQQNSIQRGILNKNMH
ncbi:MAG: RHS repeat-associated core domain-containing protein [Bacteroidota bacterium]|nr:RHS repeat-associated core domain-containing protein [Bacteroidota bacterium]